MQGGTVTTTVDGKVVETSTVKARVVEVFGMLTGRAAPQRHGALPVCAAGVGQGRAAARCRRDRARALPEAGAEPVRLQRFRLGEPVVLAAGSARPRREIRRRQSAARQGLAVPGALAARRSQGHADRRAGGRRRRVGARRLAPGLPHPGRALARRAGSRPARTQASTMRAACWCTIRMRARAARKTPWSSTSTRCGPTTACWSSTEALL